MSDAWAATLQSTQDVRRRENQALCRNGNDRSAMTVETYRFNHLGVNGLRVSIPLFYCYQSVTIPGTEKHRRFTPPARPAARADWPGFPAARAWSGPCPWTRKTCPVPRILPARTRWPAGPFPAGQACSYTLACRPISSRSISFRNRASAVSPRSNSSQTAR